MVYIKEAHPIDLWQTRANLRDGVLVSSPRTEADRSSNASQCVRNLGIRLPALIDGINDNVERDYTGWPERLYIIVPGGRVVYKSKPGPFGFSPKAMEPYLRQALGLAAARPSRSLQVL